MKKNILFSAYTLDVGGVETSLINLLNELIKQYNITLILEKKQGIFLNELNSKINVIEYNPNQNKNVLIRKIMNLLKRINFIIKYKNKFDFAASFATYSKMGSFCARTASKNNALWVHTDYLEFYKQQKQDMIKFFKFINYNKFKNIITISNSAKKSLEKVFQLKNVKVINNLINDEVLLEKSEEFIEIKKEENITTFLNVARHDEESKKITRIISCAEKLKNDDKKIRIILVGEGKDTNLYKKMVKEKKLEKEIIFLGYKKNPYPYFKISDCFLLTSEYEGYPVIFNEAKIFNLPIITTDVSDSNEDIQDKYGIVVKKDVESIYKATIEFIEEGFNIKTKFNVEEYNSKILKEIGEIING